MADIGILVFGRTGQVGSELLRATPKGFAVTGVTRPAVDLTQPSSVAHTLDSVRPAIVVNAAAYTAVDRAESDSAAAFAVNRDGAANLASACAARDLTLIHLSTDYVFDGEKTSAYTEDDPVAPLNVYGASKEAGERAVRERLERHVILRTEWVYSSFGRNFVKTMLRLGAERAELSIVADQRGSPTSAHSIARAILAVARNLATAPNQGLGTFHFTGGGETTWHGFADAIFHRVAARGLRVPRLTPVTTAEYPTPAKRPRNSMLDCRRIELVHGVTLTPWQDELDLCLDQLLTARRGP